MKIISLEKHCLKTVILCEDYVNPSYISKWSGYLPDLTFASSITTFMSQKHQQQHQKDQRSKFSHEPLSNTYMTNWSDKTNKRLTEAHLYTIYILRLVVDQYCFLTADADILESRVADGWYKANIILFILINI